VSKQYDILGNHSVAILVTNDTTGGFALFASAIPSPSGDVKKSFKLVAPLSGKFPA